MDIKHILAESPIIPAYGGGKWAMYSVGCCWWTSFPDDFGDTSNFMRGPLKIHNAAGVSEVTFGGLPCCPHCGSVLMQAPLKDFLAAAQANPTHYGEFEIGAFLEAYSRNTTTCHAGWDLYNQDIRQRKNSADNEH